MEDEISDLVISYAPVLHFHPEEGDICCYPSDPEETYQRFHLDWSQFTPDLSPKELDTATPCYYEVWYDERMIQIRYWFWYRYNKFPKAPLGLGDHLGDWEHVEIRLYRKKGNPMVVWLLSNHLECRSASRPSGTVLPGLKAVEPVLTENKIHAWVALGSHALYCAPNSKPYCFKRLICDVIEDGGAVWDTTSCVRPIHRTEFYKYQGRWGDLRAPRSPSNDYNHRWRNYPDHNPIGHE